MTDTAAPSQPLGIGRLLTDTFGLFFRRIVLFLGIALVPSLILSLLSYAVMADIFRAEAAGEVVAPDQIFTPGYFIFIALSMIASFLITGASTLAAYDAKLGRPTRIPTYVSRTLRAVVPIIVLGLVFYVMVAVGFLLLVIPGLYLIARYFVFTPAILVEGAGFSGLSRASELSRGYRWPIVLAIILFGIVIMLVSAVSQLGTGLVLAGTGGLLIFLVLQSLVSAITYGLSAVFSALLYARLREIKEGLGMDDLESVFS